jgi:hypothetical protein
MKKMGFVHGAAVALACFGMFVGQLARAAQPLVTDVALGHGGTLVGKIVDRQGVAQAGQAVRVVQQGQVVAAVETDARGEFQVADLRGGVYQIESAQGVGVYRVWADNTAPPAANDGVLIVHGDDAVRGNQCGGGVLGVLANPWVLAAIVAAAIAIPLALDDDDDVAGSP